MAATRATTVKKTTALEVKLATKNATGLAREAAALRQQATERERSIENRIELIEKAAKKEIESFRVQVVAQIKNAQELAAATVQIESKLKQDIAKLREVAVNTQAIAAEKRKLKAIEELRQEDFQAQIEAKERELETTKDLTVEKEIEIINEIFELRKQALLASDQFARDRFEEAAAARIKAIEENEKLTEKQRREAIKKEEEATNAERKLRAEILANDIKDIEQGKVAAVKDANEQILDDDKKTNDKRKAEAKKFRDAVSREFSALIKERNKENIQLIDAEIKRAQTAVDRQTEIAEKGQRNILGKEQAALDQANLEKRREAKRAAKEEQNIALAIAFLNNLAARSKTDPETAFALALRDTLGAKLFAEGLASLHDGTDSTGKVNDPLDSQGGRYAILHDNEQVWSEQNVKDGGGRTRQEAIDVLQAHDMGINLNPSHFKQIEISNMIQPQTNSNQPVINELKKGTERIEGALKRYQTSYHFGFDTVGNFVKKEIRKAYKKTTIDKSSRLG